MWYINQPSPSRTLPVFCTLLEKEQCDEYRKSFYLFSRPIEEGCRYNHYEVPATIDNTLLCMQIANCVAKLNSETFKFDVQTIKLHYCSFDERSSFPDTTPYINHDQQTIKLAFIINLNDDYEGGVVSVGIREEQQAIVTGIDVGTVMLFPSFNTIKVEAPRDGRKDIILGYCYGPQFK